MKTNKLVLLFLALSLLFGNCWTLDRDEPPCPEVTSLLPQGAPFDSIVTITGTNFLEGRPDLHVVKIGETAIPDANVLSVPSPNTLRFKVPKGIGSGAVTVALRTAEGCPAPSGGALFTYHYTATLVSALTFSGTPSSLNTPSGIDLDASGNLYVCDAVNNVVRVIATDGNARNIGNHQSPGCNGSFIADASKAQFRGPIDVVADINGDVYIGEEFNNVIRKAPASGGVRLVAGVCNEAGTAVGNCFTARLNVPRSMVKSGDILYVVDANKIRLVDVSSDCAEVTNLALSNGTLPAPIAIAYSTSRADFGPLYVADFTEKKIKSVTAGGSVKNLPMQSGGIGLNNPLALQVDKTGAIFIADMGRNQILVLYPNGDLATLAGTGGEGSTDNVPGFEARFKSPSGLAWQESSGMLYVADTGNNLIRKVKVE